MANGSPSFSIDQAFIEFIGDGYWANLNTIVTRDAFIHIDVTGVVAHFDGIMPDIAIDI